MAARCPSIDNPCASYGNLQASALPNPNKQQMKCFRQIGLSVEQSALRSRQHCRDSLAPAPTEHRSDCWEEKLTSDRPDMVLLRNMRDRLIINRCDNEHQLVVFGSISL